MPLKNEEIESSSVGQVMHACEKNKKEEERGLRYMWKKRPELPELRKKRAAAEPCPSVLLYASVEREEEKKKKIGTWVAPFADPTFSVLESNKKMERKSTFCSQLAMREGARDQRQRKIVLVFISYGALLASGAS
jgi:hypothetical protein